MSNEKVCPVCGDPMVGTTTRRRGNRYYVYAVHKAGKHRYECYLGPATEYIHAEKLNQLGLKGAIDEDRFTEYLERIIKEHLTRGNRFDMVKGIEIINAVFNLLVEKAKIEDDRKLLLEAIQSWIEKIIEKASEEEKKKLIKKLRERLGGLK